LSFIFGYTCELFVNNQENAEKGLKKGAEKDGK